jgi:hypothetical protein
MLRACRIVIASQRVGAKRRPMTGSAKQSRAAQAERIGLLRRFAPRNDGVVWMHRLLAFMLIAALAAPALAQDQPKSLKTVRIHEPAPGSPSLYVIDEDGTVRIDWPAVETLAASKADRTVLPLAQLMLAIRDGTWRPAR